MTNVRATKLKCPILAVNTNEKRGIQMKNYFYIFLLLVALLTGCSNETEQQSVLTVSAAASLSDVLEEIAAQFQEDYPNIKVQFNFGGSGSLKGQIEQGAPVDVFISASTAKFNELVEGELVEDGTNLVRNELVLITSTEQEGITTFQDLLSDDIEKIALGTPDVVPAGEYGQQALQYYDVWATVESKIVYAKDVRQVLTYVETNNVQAGIVYKTDALSSDKVRIVQTAEQSSYDVIVYPAGVVTSTTRIEDAHVFLDYLAGENVQQIWQQYGFDME